MRLSPVAVIVMLPMLTVAVEVAVRVRVAVPTPLVRATGLVVQAAVTPVGSAVAASATVPVNVLLPLTVYTTAAVLPCVTVTTPVAP